MPIYKVENNIIIKMRKNVCPWLDQVIKFKQK